jgi:hypothetical protein
MRLYGSFPIKVSEIKLSKYSICVTIILISNQIICNKYIKIIDFNFDFISKKANHKINVNLSFILIKEFIFHEI